MRLLNEVKETYRRAGLLSADVDRYKIHDLYKKKGATDKELALSGVADALVQVSWVQDTCIIHKNGTTHEELVFHDVALALNQEGPLICMT